MTAILTSGEPPAPLVQYKRGQTGTTFVTNQNLVLDSPVGAGNAIAGIVAAYSIGGGGTLGSVTDDQGNTYNIEVWDELPYGSNYAFYLTEITNAPTTITAHYVGRVDHPAISVCEYRDVTTLDQMSKARQSAPVMSGLAINLIRSGFVTTTERCLLFGGMVATGNDAATNVLPGSGFRQRDYWRSYMIGHTQDRVQHTAGRAIATWTTDRGWGGRWNSIVLAFKYPFHP